MSCNIDRVSYLSGRLTVSRSRAIDYEAHNDDGAPEECFLYRVDRRVGPEEEQEIGRPSWCGCGAGDLNEFVRALAITRGEAELLVVWEGGEFDGLHVRDGVVARKKVKITLEG